ncbi:MAG: RNA 2',3'-cyclic phosphodiesterase [Pseudomonadota bacterium]
MPRLFTALSLPEDLRASLASLRGGLRGARWIDPENYHITLRFIGDVDHRTADEIFETMHRVARHPFEVTLDGLGTFGAKKPHCLFAKVAPTPALAELQADHERRIQRLGLPAEARRFVPHVTLARLKGTPARDAADWLSIRGGFFALPFRAETFVLLSSKDSVGGGPYITEATIPLARQKVAA